MDYPKIGIVGKPFNQQGYMDYSWNNYNVISGVISDLVNENNGVVISVTPVISRDKLNDKDEHDRYELTDIEKTKIDLQIENLDGIILQGGIQTLAYEEYIAKIAMKKNIPIMGICAGFNNIIRAAGGTTLKDETGEHDQIPDEIAHTIRIAKGSNLYRLMEGEEEIGVNSIHTVVAREEDIPDEFIITAKSDDGLVEAIEGKNSPVYGYKFHPEVMATKGTKCYNPKMNNIFKDFNKRCLEYKKLKEQQAQSKIEEQSERIVKLENESRELKERLQALLSKFEKAVNFIESVKNSRVGKIFFRKKLKTLPEPEKDEDIQI